MTLPLFISPVRMILHPCQHPYGMPSKAQGFSHELKKCPPDTFLPSLRSGRSFESHIHSINKKDTQRVSFLFMAKVQ